MQAVAMVAMPRLLADEDPFGIVIACFILLVVVGAGAYAVLWLRKRIWSPDETETAGAGFTLGDLRQLHRTGQISEEEFTRAKAKIVEAAKRAAERDAARAKPGPQNPLGGGQ
jgi:hypothetical protein